MGRQAIKDPYMDKGEEMSNGKGCKSRVADHKAYRESIERIFGKKKKKKVAKESK